MAGAESNSSQIVSDFSKAKIGIALALLGVVFTTHPLISDLGPVGFTIVGFNLKIVHGYYAFAALLGCAVYMYAIGFVRTKPTYWLEIAGNTFYSVAMLVPVFYAGAWLVSTAVGWIIDRVDSVVIDGIIAVIGWGVSVSSVVYLVSKIAQRLNAKDSNSTDAQWSREGLEHIGAAQEMFVKERYELAIMEAIKGMEATLLRLLARKRTLPEGRDLQTLLHQVVGLRLIPPVLDMAIKNIVLARNRIIHKDLEATRERAQVVVGTVAQLIMYVDDFNKGVSSSEDYDQNQGIEDDPS